MATKGWFKVYHRVTSSRQYRDLPVTSKALYPTLAALDNRLSRGRGYFQRSVRQLNADSGISHNSIMPALQAMHDVGIIYVDKRPKVRMKISLHIPGSGPLQGTDLTL